MPGNAHRPKVLVVDDVPSVIRLLELSLSLEGWDVASARVGPETFEVIEREHPDVVLIEVMLPGANGFDVLARIHERYAIPVVFLTAHGTEADRAFGFELGAADYVTKPFDPNELSLRLNAVIGNKTVPQPLILRCGELEIDIGRSLARCGNQSIALRTNEWALLYALARKVGNPVPARELLVAVWGDAYAEDARYLETWIARLRARLEPEPDQPSVLTGDAGHGYTLHCVAHEA